MYLGPVARGVLGLEANASVRLTPTELANCALVASLEMDAAGASSSWSNEKLTHPIAEFEFSKPSLPLSSLDPELLTPANSCRFRAVVIYADIDGFTAFIDDAMKTGKAAQAAQALHVIRKEVRDVLADFGGRKIRYIGDCVQGLLASPGTDGEIDDAASVARAVECAAAMRSAFNLARGMMPQASSLGLQIGLEHGPVALTRVGMQKSRDRVVVGRTSREAEDEQRRCRGEETAIGGRAYALASKSVRDAFGSGRISSNINYDALLVRLKRDQHVGPSLDGPLKARAYCR